MANIEIDLSSWGAKLGKVVIPLAAIGLLIGIFIQAGRIAERVTQLLDPANPVLRKGDLVILSNQYTTISTQMEGYRSENLTTQAYVNALRVDLAKRGIDTPAPPWEGRRYVITNEAKEKDR